MKALTSNGLGPDDIINLLSNGKLLFPVHIAGTLQAFRCLALLGGHTSVIVLHFTNVLTVHQKNLNQIFIFNGVLSDRYECYSKDVVA